MTAILVNTGPTTLTKTWYVDGTATDVGDVTIGVVDESGTTVVASGTATTNNADGTYDYNLAIQTQVNRLTVTWTDVDSTEALTDYVEVVGGVLFTEAEARAFYGSDFTTAATYSDADIAEARERITDEFQNICGVSFIPRYEREVIAGTGSNVLHVRWPRTRTVIAASIGGTAVTTSNVVVHQTSRRWQLTSGTWRWPPVSDPLNVTIEYEHGFDTAPADIKRAALVLLRHQLAPDVTGSGIPARAISLTDELGTIRLSTPNPAFSRWYGIPDVDAALRRYLHLSRVF